MSANSYTTKGAPQFSDLAAPDTAVDPSLVAQYAGHVGNRVVGTAAQRAAFTSIWSGFSSGPWNGLEFEETDTGILYKRVGGAWKAWVSGWISYTPTYTGFTVGAGSYAKYKYNAGLVTVKFRLLVSAMTSTPTMTFPVTAADAFTEHLSKGVGLIPGAGSEVLGLARKNSNSSVVFGYQWLSGSTIYYNGITSTVPFTWSNTGTIVGQFDYEPV